MRSMIRDLVALVGPDVAARACNAERAADVTSWLNGTIRMDVGQMKRLGESLRHLAYLTQVHDQKTAVRWYLGAGTSSPLDVPYVMMREGRYQDAARSAGELVED